jgi:hypothetical protein
VDEGGGDGEGEGGGDDEGKGDEVEWEVEWDEDEDSVRGGHDKDEGEVGGEHGRMDKEETRIRVRTEVDGEDGRSTKGRDEVASSSLAPRHKETTRTDPRVPILTSRSCVAKCRLEASGQGRFEMSGRKEGSEGELGSNERSSTRLTLDHHHLDHRTPSRHPSTSLAPPNSMNHVLSNKDLLHLVAVASNNATKAAACVVCPQWDAVFLPALYRHIRIQDPLKAREYIEQYTVSLCLLELTCGL